MIMCIHCVCTYLQCIEILLFIFKQMLLRLTYIYIIYNYIYIVDFIYIDERTLPNIWHFVD